MVRKNLKATITLIVLIVCLFVPVQAIPITAPCEITAPGTYELTNDISSSASAYGILINSSDVILEGNGHLLEGIGANQSYGIAVWLSQYPREPFENITVENVTLTNWDIGLHLIAVNTSRISHVESDDNNDGMVLYGDNLAINGNNVYNNYRNGIVIGGYENHILNNSVNNNTESGILVQEIADGFIISDNFVYHNKYGISLTHLCDNSIAHSNKIINNEFGISVQGSNKNTISNNAFENNSIGIMLDSTQGNTIDNNSITGGSQVPNQFGLRIVNSKKTNIINNRFHANYVGISLQYTQEDYIGNNSIIGNEGIRFTGCDSSRFIENYINSEKGILGDGFSISIARNTLIIESIHGGIYGGEGINMYGYGGWIRPWAIISDNFISLNFTRKVSGTIDYGIRFGWADKVENNSVVGVGNLNTISSPDRVNGIVSGESAHCLVKNNTLKFLGTGLNFGEFDHYTITKNLIENNLRGIEIGYFNENITISNNIILNNTVGLYLYNPSHTNIIFNNIFNNPRNILFSGSQLDYYIWNLTNSSGPNIIGGPFIGGNYWASPNGTGFSQTNPDLSGDGFCDGHYIIDTNNTDYLPLTNLSSLLPDLAAVSIDGPASATIGDSIPITARIMNSGPIDVGPSLYAIFLSLDMHYDSSDIVISNVPMSPLIPGDIGDLAIFVTLPNYPVLPPGSYYLGGCADANNSIIEANESNNVAFAPHMIQINDTAIRTNLSTGWNLFSTPVKLDPMNNTFAGIFDGPSLSNITVILGWDGTLWYIPTPTEVVSPLYAYAVLVNGTAHADIVPDDAVSSPPVRSLPDGIHLVGPAPAYHLGSFRSMPLDQAFVSIEFAPGGLWGYTMVVSPPYNQPSWTYARGGFVQDLLPFKGYWVMMDNPDTLYGFSTTPIL